MEVSLAGGGRCYKMARVDAYVWIDYLNGVLSKHTDTLDSGIVEGTVAMVI